MTSKRPTGAGNCDGEITGVITNACSETISCGYCVRDGARLVGCGLTNVRAGDRVGGELGGIYQCGTSTSANYVFRCSHPDDPADCRKI
jgi:hypothetical protein